MSQLTAHIVYATFKALCAEEKETFMQLIEAENIKKAPAKPKGKKSLYHTMPEKYRHENVEMLIAELTNT